MSAPRVESLARTLWEVREGDPSLRQVVALKWSRVLATMVAQDLPEAPHWDPELSPLVLWIRGVLKAKREGSTRPRASDEDETTCGVMLGKLEDLGTIGSWVTAPGPRERCGKDKAAGD